MATSERIKRAAELCAEYTPHQLALMVVDAAIPDGWQLVNSSDLKSLLSSVSGDRYMGDKWEIEKIKSMLAAAPKL